MALLEIGNCFGPRRGYFPDRTGPFAANPLGRKIFDPRRHHGLNLTIDKGQSATFRS
jgi:hypothetical protein